MIRIAHCRLRSDPVHEDRRRREHRLLGDRNRCSTLFSFPIGHQILMVENPVLRPWFEGLPVAINWSCSTREETGCRSGRDLEPGSVRTRPRGRCRCPLAGDVFVFGRSSTGTAQFATRSRIPNGWPALILWASFVNGVTALEPTSYPQPRRTELGVLPADNSLHRCTGSNRNRIRAVRGYASNAKQHAAGLLGVHMSVPRIGYRAPTAMHPDTHVGLASPGT